MAVPVVVAQQGASGFGTVASLTIAPSGVDRGLLAGFFLAVDRNITASDFQSSAMTEEKHLLAGGREIWLFHLIAPAASSGSVSITFDGGAVPWSLGAIALTGTHQTTPIGASNTNSGSDATPTVDVTTLNADSLVADVIGNAGNSNGAEPETVGSGQTERWNTNHGTGPQTARTGCAGSTEPKVTAGLVTMDWSLDNPAAWLSLAIELRTNGAAPTGPLSNILDGNPVNLIQDGLPVNEIQG